VVDASGSSTGLLINRHPIGAFLSHHEQQVGNSVTISCAQNCCTYCCCTNQLSRTTIVVRTIINYQSLLMHSVSMFTVLSYCCRTILCDNAVAKCVQSVGTQLPSQHCAHYYVTSFYVNTMYQYQHCACPLWAPGRERAAPAGR
jgi:hypothetical protein